MPKVEMHAPFTHYRGTIGKLVYRKVRGQTIVALKPDADRPVSEAEVAHRQDFSRAAAWATTALRNDEMRQTYEEIAKERDIPARAVAVSDYLVSPSIEPLDLESYSGEAGSKIFFMATDNVGVVNALVKITTEDGNEFESGNAVELDDAPGFWMYTATSTVIAGTTVRITVTVNDRPGNITELMEEKTL